MSVLVDVEVVEPAPVVVTVADPDPVEVIVTVGASVVEITSTTVAGPRGPQGDTGPEGPQGETGEQGPPGEDADPVAYTHTQGATSDTWVIVHNLGYVPNIQAFDSGGTHVLGDVTHDSVNQTTIRFASAFSGVAYAS